MMVLPLSQYPSFRGRTEEKYTVAGVEYYNDSKATNPDAAIQGIRAMSRPTVLIDEFSKFSTQRSSLVWRAAILSFAAT